MKNIPDNLKEKLRELNKLLRNAQRTLEEGGDVDIVALDERMAEICHDAGDVPDDAEEAVSDMINNLSSSLMEISIVMNSKEHV